MPLVTLTKRQIKNERTGTDITVPSFEKASSPRNVKNYHVVVISKLPHFKKPEHSEEDTVQFMVMRDYAAFEKLQKDLLEQFSELKLPDLPRKHVLFMSEEDLEDRRVSFDCLMIIVSRSTELTTSIPMLEFLGIDLLADRKYKKRRAEYLDTKETSNEEADKEKDVEGLFGGSDQTTTDAIVQPNTTSSIFEDDDSVLFTENKTTDAATSEDLFADNESAKTSRNAKLTLLDNDVELDLTILKTGGNEEQKDGLFAEVEDNSDLLNVSDSLDDALKVVKEKPKKKPIQKGGAAKSTKTPLVSSLFEEEPNVASMGTDDISKYIQQNKTTDSDDDLELF